MNREHWLPVKLELLAESWASIEQYWIVFHSWVARRVDSLPSRKKPVFDLDCWEVCCFFVAVGWSHWPLLLYRPVDGVNQVMWQYWPSGRVTELSCPLVVFILVKVKCTVTNCSNYWSYLDYTVVYALTRSWYSIDLDAQLRVEWPWRTTECRVTTLCWRRTVVRDNCFNKIHRTN